VTAGDEEFQVDPGALISQAGETDRIGDGLTTASQAGEVVRTDVDAYGQLCQIVPALLNGLQEDMVDGMATAAQSLHDTAASLRAVAADYDATDSDAAARLHHTMRR
jgi:hypothetical protein